jgi:ribosome maturation factor RimP
MNHAITQKITNIIKDTLNMLGFDLVTVSLQGPNSKMLEVSIDKLDGTKVTIGDCKIANRNISALLDVEDIIKDSYYLHVSSAGVERPLLKLEDYTRSIGKEVKVKLTELLDGKNHYQGKVIKVEDGLIDIQLKEGVKSINFNLIKKAHLVLTDEMFRKLLNKEY